MPEVIKRGYFSLLSKLRLSTLFWMALGLAAINLAYSYSLSIEIRLLQGRTQALETKLNICQRFLPDDVSKLLYTDPQALATITPATHSIPSDTILLPIDATAPADSAPATAP